LVLPQQPPIVLPVALSFYLSLAEGIVKVDKASLTLSLYSGSATTHIAGTRDILWQIPTDTTATLRIQFSNGKWDHAELRFLSKDPVEAILHKDEPARTEKLKLTGIDFRDGEPEEYFGEDGHAIQLRLESYRDLRKHLKLPTNVGDVLKGRMFAGLNENATVDSRALRIKQITLPLSAGGAKPFQVTLRGNHTLRLRSTQLADSGCIDSIVVESSSPVTFSRLNYSVDDGELDAEISDLVLPVAQGCIAVGESVVRLASGSRLEYKRLTLSSRAGRLDSLIRGDEGILQGQFADNSNLVLAGSRDQKISFKPLVGSTITLKQHSIEVSDTVTKLIAGTGSSCSLTFANGSFPMVGRSYLNLNGGTVQVSLTGTWQSGRAPNLAGTFNRIVGRSDSGLLVLPGDYEIPLATGNIDGSGITFQTAQMPFLTGKFNSFNMQVVPRTALVFPNDKTVTISSDPKLSATISSNDMEVTANQIYPEGGFSLNLPFSTLTYQATPHVHLIKGVAVASLVAAQHEPLRWQRVAIDGEQIGSYNNSKELPSDEYQAVSHFDDGSLHVIVPHRAMIVNTVPSKSGTEITFYETSKIHSATLASNTNIDGVPLLGNTLVTIYRTDIRVKSGTLSESFVVDGKPYPAGSLVTIPWIKYVATILLAPSEVEALLKSVQCGVDDHVTTVFDAQVDIPTCLWASPKTSSGLQDSPLPVRVESNAYVFPSSWRAPSMLRNLAPLSACDCEVQMEPKMRLRVTEKRLDVSFEPLTVNSVKFSCSTCPWYSVGIYYDYVRGIWADTFNRALSDEKSLVDAWQALIEQRANLWAATAHTKIPDAEKGTFFPSEVNVGDSGLEIVFGYQVL
jgi:hypothetical protein